VNRDKIIELMLKADAIEGVEEDGSMFVEFSEQQLTTFVALVAEAEREACAKVCEKLPETFKIAADEFGYTAEQPTAENYAAAIRTRDEA
jgi:hypothetical protein